jgi:hypothetical protein
MSWLRCNRLEEVRAALANGHWPQACTRDLRAHVEGCGRCAQEILVTQHLQRSRDSAMAAAQPGTPSLLWWRAQIRRRNAAVARAGRPLAAAQIFALVVVAAAVAGVVGLHWHSLLDRALAAPGATAGSLTALLGDWGLTPLILAAAVIATLSGVVVYLTTEPQ